MKKIGLTILLFVFGLIYSNTSLAQLSLSGGFDSQFNAAYVGVGGLFLEKIHVTAEVGTAPDQWVLKGDIEYRTLRFREAEVDVYLGLGGGTTISNISEVYPSDMVEAIVSVHYHQFFVGYAFGIYRPTDPKLSGVGDYHYFKVGVFLW